MGKINLFKVSFTTEIATCNSWACEVTEIPTQRSSEEASIV